MQLFSPTLHDRIGIRVTAILFAAGFLLVLSIGNPGDAEERPNIILVMADDQGWGDVAYQGHPILKTPSLDKMARSGLRMDRFYAAAPVCSPTRAAVLTGRHPNRMGVFKWGYPMRPQEQTLAEILQANGYATGHFGKWHLGSVRNESPAHPGANGFDRWVSAPNFYDNNPILSDMGKAESFVGESSIITTKAALEWIGGVVHEKKQPFFAVIWFGSPHAPHQAWPAHAAPYAGQSKRDQNFLGEMSGIDRSMELLQDLLDSMGVKENTVVWYTSDNGALPKVGSTGGFRGHKGKVYEGGLLVPSIIQWPAKIKKPLQTSFRGNSCDILPTVLEMAGVTSRLKHPIDGVSLMPLINGKTSNKRSQGMGFWDYTIGGKSVPSAKLMKALLEAQKKGEDLPPNPVSLNAAKLPEPKFTSDKFPGHSAWISGDWKLHRIENKKGRVVFELYDLKADPKEKNDLAGSNSSKVNELKPELNEWLQSVVHSLNGNDYSEKGR